MYIDGYNQKIAIGDALRVIGYRVNHPEVSPSEKLLDGEERLRGLTAGELLDVFVAALRSGITPGVEPVTRILADDEKRRPGWPIRY